MDAANDGFAIVETPHLGAGNEGVESAHLACTSIREPGAMAPLSSAGSKLIRTAGAPLILQELRRMRMSFRAGLRSTSDTTDNIGLQKTHTANRMYR